jgi:hypothetical protein
MTALEFLRLVWPEQGYYCLAFPREPSGFSHAVFDNVEDAARYVEKVKGDRNVYFATHSLIEERIWNKQKHKDKTTKQWVAGWSVRLKTNMRYGRNFFFDVDVGKTKENYQTQAEAFTAIKSFVKTCKLPRPTIVSSGNGLHIHWTVDSDLSSNSEWLTQAERLKQLAVYYKLRVDLTKTTDTSTVLRVPDTFNIKKGLKLKVELLYEGTVVTPRVWSKRLEDALDDIDIEPAAEVLPADGLAPNITREAARNLRPPSADLVFEVCPQLQRIKAADGDLREPEWYAALGALQFAEDGRKVCHAISRGHPSYEPGYVDDKIDRWPAGPTSCQKLALSCDAEHASICAACPHVGKGVGPISIARQLEKAPPPVLEETIDGETVTRELPSPPSPYRRSKTGAIEIMVEGKNGNQFSETVHPFDLYPLSRVIDDEAETETQIWRVHLPHGKIKDISIPAATFVDDKALKIKLANNGIYTSRFDALRAYMSAYIQELQRRSASATQYTHLGWTNENTEFILPQGIIRSDGGLSPVSLGVIAETAKEFVFKRGSLEKQIELMKFFADPAYVTNQFYIAAGLASIIYCHTGHYGVIVHAAGDPGASKSTALATVASLFGPPGKYVVNGTREGATAQYRMTRMHLLSNLPFCLDEITHIGADVARNFAMDNTQQEMRGRLNPDGTPRASFSSDKSSITLTTANISLHGLLAQGNNAGTAASVRVFELPFEKLGVHKPYEVDAYLRDMKLNFGHVGEYFTRFCVKNNAKVAARVVATQVALEKEAEMTPDERFWFAAAASALTAVEVSNKIGLLDYSYIKMRKWLLEDQLPRLRGQVKEEARSVSPFALLTSYIANIHGDIVRVGSISDQIYHIPNNRLMGHYDVDTQKLDLLKEGFRVFCASKDQYSQPILRALIRDGLVMDMDKGVVLGRGTEAAAGRANCFSVNMHHPAIAGSEPVKQLLPANVVPMRGIKK